MLLHGQNLQMEQLWLLTIIHDTYTVRTKEYILLLSIVIIIVIVVFNHLKKMS